MSVFRVFGEGVIDLYIRQLGVVHHAPSHVDWLNSSAIDILGCLLPEDCIVTLKEAEELVKKYNSGKENPSLPEFKVIVIS